MVYKTQKYALVLGFAFSALGGNAFAQSFNEAVLLAINSNKVLSAELYRLDAYNEDIIQANNLRRPNLQLDAEFTGKSEGQWLGPYGVSDTRWKNFYSKNLSLSGSQTLLSGNRFKSQTRYTSLKFAQQKAKVRSIELSIIQNTIEAYANAVHDYSIFEISQQATQNLEEQLKATLSMQAGGLVGLTEVAQAKTRLASSKRQTELAKIRFSASWNTLSRIIGSEPTGLSERTFVSNVPNSLNEVMNIALKNNEELHYYRFNQDIELAQTKIIESQSNPKLSVSLNQSAIFDNGLYGARDYDTQLKFRLSIPLWSGGQIQSQKRASLANAEAFRLESLDFEEKLIENIKNEWLNYSSAQKIRDLAEEEVEAADAALKGAKIEKNYGIRTVLEVLNQEQELLNAKVNLADAARDIIISSSRLNILAGVSPMRINSILPDFDPNERIFQSKIEKVGFPLLWEKPFISLTNILEPYEKNIDKNISRAKKIIGNEN